MTIIAMIQLLWALNIMIYDNIDILPIPTYNVFYSNLAYL